MFSSLAHRSAHRFVAAGIAVAMVGGCGGPQWTASPPAFQEVAGLTQPELVAFNPEDDLTARVTPDGRYVAFVSERNGNLDVWVRDYGRDSTYPLTQNPADDFDPALHPDGASVVFVSRRSDAKGDLFMSHGLGPGADVERLTDASTQDRQPVVHPDGRRVFFTAAAGIGLEFIAEFDLQTRQTRRVSPTSGFDPAVSPDGRFLVYTAPADAEFRHPHIVALRWSDSATRAITAGEAPAGFAAFLPPSRSPYALAFVRFPDDDNGDGRVDAQDQASLWRVDVNIDALFAEGASSSLRPAMTVRPPLPRPYPLTDGGNDELFPDAGDGQLYFTQGTEQQDILRMPPTGMFPAYDDPAQYLALAEVIDDPRTRWFALRSAFARAGPERLVGAQALLAIGRLQLSRGARGLARRDFGRLVEVTRSAEPNGPRSVIGGLAQLEASAIDRANAVTEAPDPEARQAAIRQARRRIEAIGGRFADVPEVQARVALEQAELLIAEGARTRAIAALEAVASQFSASSGVAAQAMLRRIGLLGIVHDPEALSAAYVQVVRRFPNERTVVAEAAQRVVDVHLAGGTSRYGARPRLDALRRLVVRYPPGPIRRAARWRLVDELREAERLDPAALELEQLVAESVDDRFGRARALRALAELDESRGAGTAAVEGWREILQRYADLPGFASAARAAISRANLAAAARSEARGDLEAARQAFLRVIDNDVSDVQAHRRYLALSARLNVLEPALDDAARRAARSPGTPVARYAYALALSWRSPPALDTALKEIEAAIALNPQFTEAYLLRGWIREMQELEAPSWLEETIQVLYERVIESVIAVFASDQDDVGQRGGLELAIEDYKTALRLNNEAVHPRTEAEILLNLGNGHYRLADATNDPPNMRQAFDRYVQVLALEYRFDVPTAEMVYWERFGRAASWVGADAISAMATRRALALATRLGAESRRLQQLGNLALAYDQAGEEAYAKDARRALVAGGQAEVEAGRAALRLREKARARLGAADDRDTVGFEAVLTDLAASRKQLDRLDGDDPRELPTLWIALSEDPTNAQYGFGPRAERNVNLALAEQTHRALGDIERADRLAAERSALALERFEDVPGSALGLVNKWPITVFQVRERLGLLMLPARAALKAGQWPTAWARMKDAQTWLTNSIELGYVSGRPHWLWLERARWHATVAAWQARARAEGWPAVSGEPPQATTVAEGFDAIGRALALSKTATATEPLDEAAREAMWTTERTSLLLPTLSTTTAIAMTASVARSRVTQGALPRTARALAAHLHYARGLGQWVEAQRMAAVPTDARRTPDGFSVGQPNEVRGSDAGPNAVLGRTASVAVGRSSGASISGWSGWLRQLDRATDAATQARRHFEQSARLAAGAGPGLGHRLLVLSLAAWADASPSPKGAPAPAASPSAHAEGASPFTAAAARAAALALAEAAGEEGLAWSVRWAAAWASGGPPPDTEGAWPGFAAADPGLVHRVLVRTASAALAAGQVADAFFLLERDLTLRAAAGPLVEIDNRLEPEDAVHARALRARLDAYDGARQALAGAGQVTPTEWRALWRSVASTRAAFRGALEDASLRLSAAAQTRLLGMVQSTSIRYDMAETEGILMPADIDGRLHLLYFEGAETSTAPTHIATDVPFARVRGDLDAVTDALAAGRPPASSRVARFRQAVFGPLVPRLAQKKNVIFVGGFLGRPVAGLLWPEGPVFTQLDGASALAGLKSALRVGARGEVRVSSQEAQALLPQVSALDVEGALSRRTPAEAGRARAQSETIQPSKVYRMLIADAPLRLEPSALERSALTLIERKADADRFKGELPLGGLTIPATTLVLARTDISSPRAWAASLRLGATLAVAGYASTIVIPDRMPNAAKTALLTALQEAKDASPGAALAAAQAELRATMPAVDLAFLVGLGGLDAAGRKDFAQSQLRGARSQAVAALGRKKYRSAVPHLERWIRLENAAGETRRIEGIYGALVGVLRDKISPPRPAQAADAQAELLDLMTERGVDEMKRADAQVDLAHLLSLAHDFEAAEKAFAAAVDILERHRERPERLARAWFFYGVHKREQKAYEAAAAQLERSIAAYEKLGVYREQKPPNEARRALLQVASLYFVTLGDPVRARRAYERVKRYADSARMRISAEIDLARVARRRGDFIDAAAHAERAMADARRFDLLDLELQAEIESANVAWFQGDYRLGQQLCGRTLETTGQLLADLKTKGPGAKRIRRRQVDRARIFALSVCGLVAMSQRDFDGAVGFLEEARLGAERRQDDKEVATQLNNLGRVYLEFGRLQTALETFRRARAIDERLGDRYALAYDLRNIGRTLALLKVRDDARAALEQALTYAREVKDANNELRTRFALAQLDLDVQRRPQAEAGFAEALGLAERLQVKELQWQIHRYLGRMAWDRGDFERAGKALAEAVRIARTITGRSAPSEFAPDRFEAYDDLMRFRLARGEPYEAFQVTEDARRRRLYELLTDRRIDLGPARSSLQAVRSASTATAADAALDRLDRQAPRLASIWRLSDPRQLSRMLPADAAVLQYQMTRDALVVFVMTADGLMVKNVPIAAGDLRAAVIRYNQQLAARADLTTAAPAVAQWLIAPVMPIIRDKKRLAFVLQDILRYVPLPALPIEDEQVIDRFEVQRALDVRAAVGQLVDAGPPVGGVDGAVGGSIAALGAAPAPPGAADRPLPFAVRELQVIAEEYPEARIVAGEAVTRDRLLRELSEPRAVLHFAGHSYWAGSVAAGRLNDLLGGQLRTADGGVTVLDLLQHAVRADLVVLSACASLIGTTRPGAATGEDILSMAEGFHLAGARRLLGSTLSVDDVATALLMKRFYRAARTQSAAAALRTAQLTTRSLYGHPAWWAGFTLWAGPNERLPAADAAALGLRR